MVVYYCKRKKLRNDSLNTCSLCKNKEKMQLIAHNLAKQIRKIKTQFDKRTSDYPHRYKLKSP